MVAAAHASPQVVGDEACARHEVDIASFATCEGGRVALPAADGREDVATPGAREIAHGAAMFTADTRLGLSWLLVTQILAVERTGPRQDAPTGCDGGSAGTPSAIAQLR